MPENVGKNKTKGARFVRFYPSDWRSGCLGLSLEQQGLYVSICAFQWETGRRLFADDTQAAHALGLNPKNYRKVRDQLVDLGKLELHEDGYSNARAETELNAALSAGAGGRKQGGEADVGAARDVYSQYQNRGNQATERNSGENSIADQSPINPESIADQSPILTENNIENQRPFIEPVTSSHKEPPKPPQGALGEVIEFAKPVTDWRTMFGTSDDHAGIEVRNGDLILVNGTRQHWLEEFSNDERALANALKEAHAAVNPGSRKSLKVQVEARLASIVRDSKARRANALAVAAAREAPKRVKLSRW
jgi:uncharacterized protein YdaU (DUF1376 family)